jgi:hypothetical protein
VSIHRSENAIDDAVFFLRVCDEIVKAGEDAICELVERVE